jgi:hypothetical protein
MKKHIEKGGGKGRTVPVGPKKELVETKRVRVKLNIFQISFGACRWRAATARRKGGGRRTAKVGVKS